MKTLHFFWIQGEEHLREKHPHLYKNQFDWIKNHQGWDILFWNYNSLQELIINYYPKYFSIWERIQQNKFNEKHIFAKIVDFSKFFVFHKFGGFFIDRDLVFQKPLDDLVKYRGVIGSEVIEKKWYSSHEVAIKMWDRVKDYKFVFQDCLIGIEKDSNFGIEFINWCIDNDRVDLNTLESFSVWALTDFYLGHKNKFEGFKILSEDQMLRQSKDGYCYHTLNNGWMDKTKEIPWDN